MNIGFIGAGKVGFSLGKYFSENGISISGYFSKTSENAKNAADFTGSSFFYSISELINSSDIIFITSNDSSIRYIWNSVYNEYIFEKIICHCSGSLSSDIFIDAKKKGAFVCSIHPMLAINSKQSSFKKFKNAFFTIEGDDKAINVFSNIFNITKNRFCVLKKNEYKALYHIAAVFSSNFVTALIDISMKLLLKCGFDKKEALLALSELVIENAKNNINLSPEDALTGPVERNDLSTIKKHIDAIKKFDLDKDIEKIYKLLSLRLINIAENKNLFSDYSEMKQSLKYYSD